MTDKEFIEWLKRDVRSFGTQKEAAWRYGVSAPYLSDVLKGNREPGQKLLEGVGFRRVIGYERKDESQ